MKRDRDIVTDHAVVRYLERVYGVDIGALKARIARITEDGREAGAAAVNADGVTYKLGADGRVVTIAGTKGKATSNRALRWKRRRS